MAHTHTTHEAPVEEHHVTEHHIVESDGGMGAGMIAMLAIVALVIGAVFWIAFAGGGIFPRGEPVTPAPNININPPAQQAPNINVNPPNINVNPPANGGQGGGGNSGP